MIVKKVEGVLINEIFWSAQAREGPTSTEHPVHLPSFTVDRHRL